MAGREVVDLTSSPPPSQGREVVTIEDREDEDLKLAIAMSLQPQEEETTRAQVIGAETLPTKQAEHHSAGQPTNGLAGTLGLDRKAMEAERLARLKRKRGDEEQTEAIKVSLVSPRKLRSVSPPALRRASQQPKVASTNGPATKSLQSTSSAPQLYPDGIVLKTYAPGYPTERTISFPDLIYASSLQSALLSSFIWDFDWLFPHFETKTTKFLLVMHAKYPSERQRIEADFGGIPNIKLCFPPMEGQVNCMHSKLMLLFYESRCRIVVPTANLMGFDWGVGSVMENMVWLIDLPVLPGGASGDETDFKMSLLAFLRALTVAEDVVKKLDRFDFGTTKDVGFVHSIGGSHSGESWRETGHCGLGKTVRGMGLASDEPVEVDFVTSSVGSLNNEFMRCMYLAAQGDNGLTELSLRAKMTLPFKRSGHSGKELVQNTAGQEWRGRFRFYFPSQQVVACSNGGERSAGTICFSEKWWEGSKFPRTAMRECISARDGLLMHNKLIFVRFPQAKVLGEKPCAGWAYVGSANLSESAWGRLVQDKETKSPKLNCRNWECGIVMRLTRVPLPALCESGLRPGGGDKLVTEDRALESFSATLPLPIRVPAESYDETSSRKPWFSGNG